MSAAVLSVVIPAFDEAARIGATLEALVGWMPGFAPAGEVVIVDDGSRDRTVALVEQYAESAPFPLWVVRTAHAGKGAALRAGVAAARGELLLLMDADLSVPLDECRRLGERIAAGADVAIASRDAAGARLDPPQPPLRRALAGGFRRLRRTLLVPGLLDTQCGCKLFRGEVARRVFACCREDGWLIDVEALAVADHLGYRIDELGVTWSDRAGTHVRPMAEVPRSIAALLRIRRRLATIPPAP